MKPIEQHLRRTLVIVAWGAMIGGCRSSAPTPVEMKQAALVSSEPGTVVPGTPLQRTASCPGNTFPDLCGSWEGVELDASTADASPDQHCFCRSIAFQVPASLPVKTGNAGTGDTFLTFRKAGALHKCIYHGNARNGQSAKMTGGDAYTLVNCTDGSKAGSTVKADWFSLDVHGGDKSQGPTEVSVRLGAPDVVNGVVQEQIVYASDPRIPGAALHIPRGSTPANQDFSLTVLPQPAVGSRIANGGNPAVTLGYALDVHATGVDHFAFAAVPGATCPRIDLPYSPAALASLAGAGADGRLSARQITDLAGVASGASVLVPTSDVTIDPVNHLVTFCVSHLSFYAPTGNPYSSALNKAYLTTPPTRACGAAADCNPGEVCDGSCYLDLIAKTPTLLPNTQYLVHLDFQNTATDSTGDWPKTDVGLWTVSPKPITKLTQTAWHANAPQVLMNPVPFGQNMSFDVFVTSPPSRFENSADYPYGSALDLCLVNSQPSATPAVFAPFGECFSWEPLHKPTLGTLQAPIVEVCGDNVDNDDDGYKDDPDGNPATMAGASCDNGQSGTCKRPGIYVCNGSFATQCNAPAVTPTVCGGCTPLGQQPGTACATGEKGACAAGVVQCDGLDKIKCIRLTGPSSETCDGVDNDCNGNVDDLNGNVATEPGAPCNAAFGICNVSGAYQCDGPNATKCVTGPPPASSGIPCDVDPQNGQPAGTGACAQAGELDCSSNCIAPSGIPSSDLHTEPAHTPNGDTWDWNCNGQIDHESSTICHKPVEAPGSDPALGLCLFVEPITYTEDLASSICPIFNCPCVANAVPDCGQPGAYSHLHCNPADPFCISLSCTEASPGVEGCN